MFLPKCYPLCFIHYSALLSTVESALYKFCIIGTDWSLLVTHVGTLYITLQCVSSDSRQMEDMDISPGSTPTNSRPSSRPNSRTGTPHVGPASTPVSITTSTSSIDCTPRSYAPTSVLGAISALPALVSMPMTKTTQSQDLTQQAIQTLQKLREALIIQQFHQKQPHQSTIGNGKSTY